MKTGDIFALSQLGGSSPLLTELWKIALNPGASCLAQFLSIMFEMLSGPIAFDVFMFCNSFSIPGVLISSSVSSCLKILGNTGKTQVPILVNTDLNCSTRICALSLLSLNRDPFRFRGAVPILSCLFDLIYLQNGLLLLFSNPS